MKLATHNSEKFFILQFCRDSITSLEKKKIIGIFVDIITIRLTIQNLQSSKINLDRFVFRRMIYSFESVKQYNLHHS